jgi:hypothetical protein
LNIPLCFANLRFEPGVDGDIASRLPHAIVALQERFLSLDLAMNILYGRIVVHLGGWCMCWEIGVGNAELERLHERGGIMMLLVVEEVVVGRAPPEIVVQTRRIHKRRTRLVLNVAWLELEGIYRDPGGIGHKRVYAIQQDMRCEKI